MRGAIPCSQCRDGPICKTQRGKIGRKAEEERGRWVKRYEIGVVVVWCAHPKLRQANTTLTQKGACAFDVPIVRWGIKRKNQY